MSLKWQLLTNDVSTGAVSAVKPPGEGDATLVNDLGLAGGDIEFERLALCFLRNAAECAAEETKFSCLTFPAEVEQLFDNCVNFFCG